MKHYETLAQLRVNDAIRGGLQAQQVERILAEGKPASPSLLGVLGAMLRWMVSLVLPR
jgi:hypothetical protein